MAFDLKDLGSYFDSSAHATKDATANKYGVASSSDAVLLYEQVVGELLHVLDLSPTARVLDVGCGTGEVLERIASRCPDILGLDLSSGMTEIVKAKGHRALAYDGGVFPFEDSSFDVAIVYQVFINLPSADIAENLLREAVRVTRKGGTILIGAVPHPAWSRMPTHDRSWWVNTKIWLRRLAGRQTIPYYAYDYSFFGRLFDSLKLERLAFARCSVPRKGWETKYHVILTR